MKVFGTWSLLTKTVLVLAALFLCAASSSFALTDAQKANWPALSGVPMLGQQGGNAYGYDVTSCLVVLKVQKDSSDIQVLLDVTYNNWAGKKSAGFRWLGDYTVTDYTCFDGTGKQLETYVDGTSGKTLVWYFPEFEAGTQRIIAKYTLKGDLKHDGALTVVDAPWAGVWRIPVEMIRVEVEFPQGVNPEVRAISPAKYGYEKIQRDGQWVVAQRQQPKTVAAFSLSYVEKAPTEAEAPPVVTTPDPYVPTEDPGTYPGSESASGLEGLIWLRDAILGLFR